MEERNHEKKRIVVAVDESEESMYALSWCLHNLLLTTSSPQLPHQQTNDLLLLLLYVKPPPPVYTSLDATRYFFGGDVIATMDKYSKDVAASVMRRAESICNHFGTHIQVEKKVGTGEAKDVICVAVEKLGADMLVMGSHDYGFFERAFVGSVSEHCAKHVKCPVVVVKRPKTAAAAAEI